MIGGLQGEFGDLDIKYLKQNISKSRSEISGSFRRTPRHCILRENSSGKHYQRIRTCLTGEVETSSSPIRLWDIRMWNIRSEDPDMSDRGSWNVLLSHPAVRYSKKVEWAMPRVAIRSNSIRIPQEDTRRAPLSGLPQGEAHGTREHHTLDNSISYPDMLSGSLTKVSKSCYVIPPSSDGVSGRLVRTSLPWILKNSPQSRISLVIKKLSKHQNLTQFD